MRRFLCVLPVVLSGCIALSSAETGRVVGSGGEAHSVVVTSGAYSQASLDGPRDPFAEQDSTYDPLVIDYVPVAKYATTFGLGARTDVGLYVNSIAMVGVRAKHQLVGGASSPLAVAVRAEAGGNLFLLGFGGAYGYATGSAIVSYHPSPEVAVFVSPQITTVGVAPPEGGARPSSAWTFPGLSYGVALGKGERFAIEIAHARSDSPLPSQVSVGYRLRLP